MACQRRNASCVNTAGSFVCCCHSGCYMGLQGSDMYESTRGPAASTPSTKSGQTMIGEHSPTTTRDDKTPAVICSGAAGTHPSESSTEQTPKSGRSYDTSNDVDVDFQRLATVIYVCNHNLLCQEMCALCIHVKADVLTYNVYLCSLDRIS